MFDIDEDNTQIKICIKDFDMERQRRGARTLKYIDLVDEIDQRAAAQLPGWDLHERLDDGRTRSKCQGFP